MSDRVKDAIAALVDAAFYQGLVSEMGTGTMASWRLEQTEAETGMTNAKNALLALIARPEPVGAETVTAVRRFGMASSNAQKAFMEDQAGGSHRAYLDAVQEEESAEAALLALLAEPEPPAISEAEIEAGAKALYRVSGWNGWDGGTWETSRPLIQKGMREKATVVLDAARRARE